MEVMSDDFAEFLDLLNRIGRIIIVDDRVRKLWSSGYKETLEWCYIKDLSWIKYYEKKKEKKYAIQCGKYVYLCGIGYINDEPFIIASKRDKRSVKSYTEVRKKDTNDTNY